MRPNRFRIERLLEEPIECQQITTASTLVSNCNKLGRAFPPEDSCAQADL